MKSETIKYILGISFLISMIGFILDLHERVDDIFINIFEIGMMTILIFVFIFTVSYSLLFLKRQLIRK